MDHVTGDLQLAGDGLVAGWCWSPTRPRERLVADVLIDDAVVASTRADLLRDDLKAAGYGDGRHAFVLPLPAGALGQGAPCLISARERQSAIVFGRHLHEPGVLPEDPRQAALQAEISAVSGRLAAVVAGASVRAPAQRLRDAAAELAGVLRARAGGRGVVAAAESLLAREPIMLPTPRMPGACLLLWADNAPDAIRAVRTAAPVARALAARVVLAHPGQDARITLLASIAPGLMLMPGCAEPVAALFRPIPMPPAPWRLLLDPLAVPSAAGLADLLPRLAAAGIDLALAPGLGARVGELQAIDAPAPGVLAVVGADVAGGDLPALRRAARSPALLRNIWRSTA